MCVCVFRYLSTIQARSRFRWIIIRFVQVGDLILFFLFPKLLRILSETRRTDVEVNTYFIEF